MPTLIMDESASFDVVIPAKAGWCRSRESGNPVSWWSTTLGPRFRGDDDQLHRSIDAISEA
jgi:hypothetical protein